MILMCKPKTSGIGLIVYFHRLQIRTSWKNGDDKAAGGVFRHFLCRFLYILSVMDKRDSMESKGVVEQVRSLLRAAFAGVECPDSFKRADACGPMLHSVAIQLRQDFYNYEPSELQYMLPAILEDAIDTRLADAFETQGIEMLVLQLNPFSVDNDIVRRSQLELFANFSPKQSEAVAEWLRLARTWEELSRYQDWVDAALDYWASRASQLNGVRGTT